MIKKLYNKLLIWINKKLLEREYKKINLEIKKLKPTGDIPLLSKKNREAINIYKKLKKLNK